NILSRRLARLEADGLVVGEPYSTRPVRHVYRLTARSAELAGALRMLAGGAAPHDLPAAEVADGPPGYGACGTPVGARGFCPSCDVAVDDPAPPDGPAGDALVWMCPPSGCDRPRCASTSRRAGCAG